MRDELNKNQKCTPNECLILNIDHSSNPGTHWTCLFIKNKQIIYFDSFSYPPPLEIKDYCKYSDRLYNSYKIQKWDEVICGHYCIYVLYKLGLGFRFYDILNELYRRNN